MPRPDDLRSQMRIDAAMIRERLSMLELCQRDGVDVKRHGSSYVATCPFHDERSASFNIGGRAPDRAHCFGCGWDGDIFQYWQETRGVEFGQAVTELGSLCGVRSRMEGVQWKEPAPKKVTGMTRAEKDRQKPALPPMRALRADEIETLARLRGLSVEGVRAAAVSSRRVGFAMWPQWQRRRGGPWTNPCAKHFFKCAMDTPECEPRPMWPSWVVTDAARRVAEFRRLDGQVYPKSEGDGIKAWSTSGKAWPLGAAEIGSKLGVLLVEGGPDMLAAYHFLHGFGMLHEVAAVAVLGASNRLAEDALPYFAGKRVRIFMDEDAEQTKVLKRRDGHERIIRTRPGYDAAARWSEQIRAVGGVVEAFSLDGLRKVDGAPVKDLNDLALIPKAVWDDEEGVELIEAFCDWDF
jgi:hypothetical protein